MNKNFLKMTTILCSLYTLPNALLAESETGTRGTYTITNGGNGAAYSTKTSTSGDATAFRQVENTEDGINGETYDTGPNGKTISTYNWVGDGYKDLNEEISGSKGAVAVGAYNEDGQKGASKTVYHGNKSASKSVSNENGVTSKTKKVTIYEGPVEGSVSKTRSSDGTVSTTVSEDNMNEPWMSKSATITKSGGTTTITTSSGEEASHTERR